MSETPPAGAPSNGVPTNDALDLFTGPAADFICEQLREYGNAQIEGGYWIVFTIETAQVEQHDLAERLLQNVSFQFECGQSEDERWTLYYVDAANRPLASYWLEDLEKRITGALRPPSPAQRALFSQLAEAEMPHRIAQRLVDDHARGDLSAGSISDAATVRSLLDRLHNREPLFYSAFQNLLGAHLLDLTVLLRVLITEDIELFNDGIRGALSKDPFLRTRQTAVAEIRQQLIRFHLINSLDQQKAVDLRNPYRAYFDIVTQGEEIRMVVDGMATVAPLPVFRLALQTIRKNLYRGTEFARFDTQVPWMNEHIASSFRYIKGKLDNDRSILPQDALFMLERALVD